MDKASAITADERRARDLADKARAVLQAVKRREWSIATAESCTGGLLASLLTDMEGLSGSFDRGFVTYATESKTQVLGIDPILIARHGVVSREVAMAMAKGALENSDAKISAGITGFAGPASADDEAGLVHLAVRATDGTAIHRECHFGQRDRDSVRLLAAEASLDMLLAVLEDSDRG